MKTNNWYFILILLFSVNIQIISNWKINNRLCICDFTNKLSNVTLEKKSILCEMNPSNGDTIKIIGNANYVNDCFKNSRIYCPLKNEFIPNANLLNYTKNIKINKKEETINDNKVFISELIIDKDATDINFYCFIKPAQISEYLKGIVKINLIRQISNEYSKQLNDYSYCDFTKGNLNINPSLGHYNSRIVTCYHNIKSDELFILKLPKIKNVTDKFLSDFVDCLSEFKFINFTMKEMEEFEKEMYIKVIFGNSKRSYNLTCSFDLSNYNEEPCSIGKKGLVVFLFGKKSLEKGNKENIENK